MKFLESKPQAVSVLFRKLKDGQSYEDFRKAWLPPVDDVSHYFDTPILVINAQNVSDPTEIISIGLVFANIEEAMEKYEKYQVIEDIRQEKIDKITDQSAETRFCNVLDIDILGS